MVLLMAGIADARKLAVQMRSLGHAVIAATVTGHAARPFQSAGFRVHVGALDAQGLAQLIRREKVEWLVDATHPYAEQAHREAADAARQTGISCLRYERKPAVLPSDDRLHWTADHEQAAELAHRLGGTVFLTAGSRYLEEYAGRLLGEGHVRMVVRLLPTIENMVKCDALGIDQADIVAIQGPFSQALNRELYQKYEASVMVTKESGGAGGVGEKVRAALAEQMQVIVVRRPPAVQEVETFSNMDALLYRLRVTSIHIN